MNRVLAIAVPALLLGLGLPEQANAYLKVDKFGEVVTAGGAMSERFGARRFTGSLRDGYTCAVCHTGAEPPSVDLTATNKLFEDGYIPGAQYQIGIFIRDDVPKASLAMEVVDQNGNVVGSVGLPDVNTLPTEAKCDPDPVSGNQSAASFDLDLRTDGREVTGGETPQREVVAMDACGARRAQINWTAPAAPQGTVRIHVAVVGGDDSNSPDGDGVTELERAVPVRGTSTESAYVGSSNCAASGGSPAALGWLLLPVLFVLGRRRGRS